MQEQEISPKQQQQQHQDGSPPLPHPRLVVARGGKNWRRTIHVQAAAAKV